MRSYAAEKLPSASKILPGDTTVLAHLSCRQVTALPNSEGPLVSLSALSGMGVRKRTEISSKFKYNVGSCVSTRTPEDSTYETSAMSFWDAHCAGSSSLKQIGPPYYYYYELLQETTGSPVVKSGFPLRKLNRAVRAI